ncbi:7-dehydrocholesterol reductase-like protein [Parasponia andersonii]|uniref:7-dehydrocholesterol reductase-like protein n=1 Tax=Parasponia andersonii TaxID=3476 RepID=A0A2P5A6P5_PARAD|nr:7-dehydrocholesterol reductase-like protein [Parasponia andersonii]
MSAYDNVVGGKLKLKGKALDVKAGGMKKKKKHKKLQDQKSLITEDDLPAGGSTEVTISPEDDEINDGSSKLSEEGKTAPYDEHLTSAEKRYIEQRERIDNHRLKKTANKSHRDRIQDFNQYLANMSEHYDIPKVGPG